MVPNFQTYAFLIEACWRMGEAKKLESFVQKMESEVFFIIIPLHAEAIMCYLF